MGCMRAKLYETTSLGLRRVVQKIHGRLRSGLPGLVEKDLFACQKALFGRRKRNCCALILKCMTSSWRDLDPQKIEILKRDKYNDGILRRTERDWFHNSDLPERPLCDTASQELDMNGGLAQLWHRCRQKMWHCYSFFGMLWFLREQDPREVFAMVDYRHIRILGVSLGLEDTCYIAPKE